MAGRIERARALEERDGAIRGQLRRELLHPGDELLFAVFVDRLPQLRQAGFPLRAGYLGHDREGTYTRTRAAMRCATIAASSPTPMSREDLRLRRKWTPTK